MRKIFGAILFLSSAIFIACMSSTSSGLVGADRNQLFLYSEAQMNQSAATQYSQVIAEAKAAKKLNTDPATYNRVQKIAADLIAKTSTFRNDAPDWDWEVNVIADSTINAWCMPGGKIVVYTGIINSLKLTDGELAAVMGHEISHALKEHSREQASRATLTQLGIAAISSIANLGDLGTMALALGAQYGITLPFSRDNETEADNMGTELMARAGYDPNEAVSIWKKMNSLTTSSTPEFMSTHPSNSSRISNLQKIAEKVWPLYEEAK